MRPCVNWPRLLPGCLHQRGAAPAWLRMDPTTYEFSTQVDAQRKQIVSSPVTRGDGATTQASFAAFSVSFGGGACFALGPGLQPTTWRNEGLDVNEVIAMREINIKLWCNDEFRDWSIAINGRFYVHVPDEALTELVEGAMIVAAKSLIQTSVNAGAPQGR
jgi:hypothetical protein